VRNRISDIDMEIFADINDRSLWKKEDYIKSVDSLISHYKMLNLPSIAKLFRKNLTG